MQACHGVPFLKAVGYGVVSTGEIFKAPLFSRLMLGNTVKQTERTNSQCAYVQP